MAKAPKRIQSFDFQPGRRIAGRYEVQSQIGKGWEGEVYRIIELKTGIPRAAKVFYPQRNRNDKAVKFYATKLDKLRKCPIVIQYHLSETIRYCGMQLTCLISELVEGELLSKYINRQPGKRLHYFEALQMLYTLVRGLEQIHRLREYHGDIHSDNILIQRRGINFDVNLFDFFYWGKPNTSMIREDVIQLVGLLYELIGGQKHYRRQPPEIKAICKGLRRDLITKQFPTARHLREHLESFNWESK